MPVAQLQLERHAAAPPSLALLYIGRIARETGLVDVVQGLRQARKAGCAARLTIAGGGEDEFCMRKLVERLDLEDRVHFRAPVYGEARLALLHGADLSILPCSGTGGLEALHYSLLAGVPVIARRTDCLEGALVDRVHGLLLPADEPGAYGRAFCELAADRPLLARLRASCRGAPR